MKLIGVTQRIEFIKEYSEKRDCLDQKWIELLNQCNLIPILLPNNLETAKNIVTSINLEGMLFTGGDSLVKYGGNFKERDVVEKFCIEFSIENNLPVLGVCRGMQVIQDYFGIRLHKVDNHVGEKHQITYNDELDIVNSFHNLGSKETNEKLIIKSFADDGIIEAIKHVQYKIQGIMWHPERIYPFSKRDIDLFNNFYN